MVLKFLLVDKISLRWISIHIAAPGPKIKKYLQKYQILDQCCTSLKYKIGSMVLFWKYHQDKRFSTLTFMFYIYFNPSTVN